MTEQQFEDLNAHLRDEFGRFGRITKVWIARRPAGFGEGRAGRAGAQGR